MRHLGGTLCPLAGTFRNFVPSLRLGCVDVNMHNTKATTLRVGLAPQIAGDWVLNASVLVTVGVGGTSPWDGTRW